MSIARAISWPIRRLLDPRFKGLAEQADAQHDDLAKRLDNVAKRLDLLPQTVQQEMAATRETLSAIARADLDASREANELMGRSLSDLLGEMSEVSRILRKAGLPANVQAGVDAKVETLDSGSASFLNYASGHRGFAAQEGLWFNPPISVAYEEGRVRPAMTNERIVELPYVFRALSRAEPGTSVLDIGAAESTVAFSLASLGYDVTALDLRPYPLVHPRLKSVEGDIREWDPGTTFDVVLCISTLEHIGLATYGENASGADDSSDGRALERIRTLTRPGGVLVLTVPFGDASADMNQRSYDREDLERLLDTWKIEDVTVVRRENDLTWAVGEDGGSEGDDLRRVALVTALRPAD